MHAIEVALTLASSIKLQFHSTVRICPYDMHSLNHIRGEITDAILLAYILDSSMKEVLFERFRNIICAIRSKLHEIGLLAQLVERLSFEMKVAGFDPRD